MDANLRQQLEFQLGTRIKSVFPVSGGDIATAYGLETATNRFFCKLMPGDNGNQVLSSERAGLEAIKESGTVATPEVMGFGLSDEYAFLILEYIQAKRPEASEMRLFGTQLAKLHLTPSKFFGWDTDNFIGRLPQSNKKSKDWVAFYLGERLMPQLNMARDHNLLSEREIPSEDRMRSALERLLGGISPVLIHGDLWSGNYLISEDGVPYLIDPSVYYGHGEVDLAMSRLFGGFGPEFYQGYHEIHALKEGQAQRQDLYQLYYLLVHLNLFGRSYYHSVAGILKKYF
ncbi:fructosamine kinase family protein [Poritiphilus flavus]|uniref:Phosphotransferase n=1 Tax=Poritiphilus flavus TaxID=2697053 RepID=A0A6L9E8U2_9FLAO|nr:fructosamine kinase family protein [Poritiphilus flavus]NAS11023.1 phosphotransferase [Poritiphilus flavus]